MPEDRTSEVPLSIPSLILSCDTGISPTVNTPSHEQLAQPSPSKLYMGRWKRDSKRNAQRHPEISNS